jgi:hypothetical protein
MIYNSIPVFLNGLSQDSTVFTVTELNSPSYTSNPFQTEASLRVHMMYGYIAPVWLNTECAWQLLALTPTHKFCKIHTIGSEMKHVDKHTTPLQVNFTNFLEILYGAVFLK